MTWTEPGFDLQHCIKQDTVAHVWNFRTGRQKEKNLKFKVPLGEFKVMMSYMKTQDETSILTKKKLITSLSLERYRHRGGTESPKDP